MPPGQLISQQIKPLLGTVDAGRAAIPGEPMLPAAFEWQRTEYPVLEVLESWKETGPCSHGSGERYVNKHWYRIRTTGGEMKIYFERKARSKQDAKKRWWLYTFTPDGGAAGAL